MALLLKRSLTPKSHFYRHDFLDSTIDDHLIPANSTTTYYLLPEPSSSSRCSGSATRPGYHASPLDEATRTSGPDHPAKSPTVQPSISHLDTSLAYLTSKHLHVTSSGTAIFFLLSTPRPPLRSLPRLKPPPRQNLLIVPSKTQNCFGASHHCAIWLEGPRHDRKLTGC